MARIRAELPAVSAARRRAILELGLEPQLHAELLAEFDFLGDVECAPGPSAAPSSSSARVACWNAERGRAFDGASALLGVQHADWLLLTELDLGMARSGQRHVARELAEELACGYVFGIEFVELGLGSEAERQRHAGSENLVGQHGAAILSPHPLRDPELVRLEDSGRWFDGELGERRVGGRMAILATADLGGIDLTLASVHLESHSDPEERCAEFAVLLDAIERRAPGGPALIGGDLNTSSLARADLVDRERLARALERDPDRLRHPVRHEPLFSLAERAGYDWRACNRLELATHRVATPGPSSRGSLRLDWFLCRGLVARDPAVVAAVDASGAALSDHELLSLRVEPGVP
jgi:endonuclease/exonuclease/phosphatase family metal-dependent hydrolase